MQWYYIHDGQRFGPVEESELIRLASQGLLTPTDLVWNASMGQEWKPASTVPNLFATPATPQKSGIPGATHNRDLMQMARESLQGQWGLAVGAALLYQIVINGIQFFSGFGTSLALHFSNSSHAHFGSHIGSVIILLIAGPMLFGFNRFFIKVARKDSPDISQLFDGFKYFGKTLGAYLLVCLFMILWSLLLILPAIVAAILIPAISNHSSSAVLLIPILIVVGILGILPIIRAGLSYSQVFYILADNPTTGAYEAIQLSVSMMDGLKWKLFCLGFRFIGWFLLCILTCFIGFLWLYPYMTTSYAHFYDDIRGT